MKKSILFVANPINFQVDHLLLKYLESILDLVSSSIKELEKVQVENETIDRFYTDLHDIRSKILERRNGIFQSIVTALEAIQKNQLQEKELQSLFYESLNLQQ